MELPLFHSICLGQIVVSRSIGASKGRPPCLIEAIVELFVFIRYKFLFYTTVAAPGERIFACSLVTSPVNTQSCLNVAGGL